MSSKILDPIFSGLLQEYVLPLPPICPESSQWLFNIPKVYSIFKKYIAVIITLPITLPTLSFFSPQSQTYFHYSSLCSGVIFLHPTEFALTRVLSDFCVTSGHLPFLPCHHSAALDTVDHTFLLEMSVCFSSSVCQCLVSLSCARCFILFLNVDVLQVTVLELCILQTLSRKTPSTHMASVTIRAGSLCISPAWSDFM